MTAMFKLNAHNARRRKPLGVAILAGVILLLLCATAQGEDEGRDVEFLDFNAIPTASAEGFVVAAEPYLLHASDGIRITARSPANARVVFINNLGLYSGRAVAPTLSQNFLTLSDTGNVPASFTMEFATGVERVSFRIPRLFAATESGVTFPAWTATAYGPNGEVLSTHAEALRRRFADIPEEDVTLVAPGFELIKCVRIESDPRLNGVPFAGFSAALIERLAYRPRLHSHATRDEPLARTPTRPGCGLPNP